MKNKDLEKYITELSPELLEKARQCRNRDELNLLLAENDVELSEDALAAAAGGGNCGSLSNPQLTQGDEVEEKCTECGQHLYYWDFTLSCQDRLYCNNSACIACQEHWLFNVRGNGVHRVK